MTPLILTFVLDDDPIIAEFFNEILNKEGLFNIKGFTNPAEFKQAINKDVNLVLLDINIPGHGYDIFEMIKYLHAEYPGIYIVVISGFLDVKIVLDFVELEVFDIIDKNGLTFIEKLKGALERVKPKILYKINALEK